MARKVTADDIKQMNILYKQLGTYAAVSRVVGFAPSTVKNYIDPHFDIVNEDDIIRFDPSKELPADHSYLSIFAGLDNYGELCKLSDKEVEEIKNLWKEIML